MEKLPKIRLDMANMPNIEINFTCLGVSPKRMVQEILNFYQ